MPPKKTSEAATSTKKRKAEPAPTKASDGSKKTKTANPFPGKVGKSMTVAQLREEAKARGMDLGNVKHDKSFLLNALGEGSLSIVSLAVKQKTISASNFAGKKAAGIKSTTSSSKKNKAPPKTKKPPTSNVNIKAASGAASKSQPAKHVTAKKAQPATPTKTKKGLAQQLSIKKFASPKPLKVASSGGTSSSLKPAAKSASIKKSSSNTTATKIKGEKSMPKKTGAKRNVTAATEYPRISNKLTLAHLKEEVFARQLDPKKVPKLKGELLHHLVEGSIYVKETNEYKVYQNLLTRIESEKHGLHEKSLAILKEKEAKQEARRKAQYEKHEKLRQAEERQRQQERNEEISRQRCLHTHSFPRVHIHHLALSNSLLTSGSPRRGRCNCCDNKRTSGGARIFSFSQAQPSMYSCETCDWDICQECFDYESKSDAEKKRIQKQREAEERKREEEERKKEEERISRWDAQNRFKPAIIKLAAKNKKPNLKFTVWCSDGYDYDGWHSYEGEPMKEFDSSWVTKKEANERAEFLFFWKNPWGMAPNQVSDEYQGEPEPIVNDGMKKWSVSPDDSSRWTVGVVPAAAYLHLENASNNRHNYDDEREPKSYEENHYGSFF